jgi:hypothetical protein
MFCTVEGIPMSQIMLSDHLQSNLVSKGFQLQMRLKLKLSPSVVYIKIFYCFKKGLSFNLELKLMDRPRDIKVDLIYLLLLG